MTRAATWPCGMWHVAGMRTKDGQDRVDRNLLPINFTKAKVFEQVSVIVMTTLDVPEAAAAFENSPLRENLAEKDIKATVFLEGKDMQRRTFFLCILELDYL